MSTVLARLTPWAVQRITKDYGKVTKQTLRQSIKDFPGTEFWTLGTPEQRAGATFTYSEVPGSIVEVYTVTTTGTSLLAVVTVHPSGNEAVVR